jgi:hypothetical protein
MQVAEKLDWKGLNLQHATTVGRTNFHKRNGDFRAMKIMQSQLPV